MSITVDLNKIAKAVAAMPVVGSVCMDHDGVFGIVVVTPKCCRGGCNRMYEGVTLDGKHWRTTKPIVVTKTVGEYIQRVKDEAFELGTHHPYEGE